MKEKYFRLFHYRNGIETEIVKVSNLYTFFLSGHLSENDLCHVCETDTFPVKEEDYYAIQLRHYRYEYTDMYIVADESGTSISVEELETVYARFVKDFPNVEVDGLFGVPDVVRGVPIDGTGKRSCFKKLKAIQCLNEIKQTCDRHLDEFEPDVKPDRRHHNMGCWEDAYYFREHQSKNWKNYRKKQYK